MKTELQLFSEWFENTYPEDFKKYNTHFTDEHFENKNFISDTAGLLNEDEQEMLNRYIRQFYELHANEN